MYYKITKQQLLKFYNEYVKTFHILPTFHTNELNFKRIYNWANFNNSNFEYISKSLTSNNEHIREYIPFAKFNNYIIDAFELLQKESNNPKHTNFANLFVKLGLSSDNSNSEETRKHNSKIFKQLAPHDLVELVSSMEESLGVDLIDEFEMEYYFTPNLVHQYLFNQEKIDNFQHIISYIGNKNQTSIININFGDDEDISLDPIENLNGLNQAFAAHYLDNETYIIKSDSPTYLIQRYMGDFSIPNEDEINAINQNSANYDYINLDNIEALLNSNNFEQVQANDMTPIKELDIFEDTLIRIKENTISSDECIPILVQLLEKQNSEKTTEIHEPHIEQFVSYIVKKAEEEPEIIQNSYLTVSRKLFDEKKFDVLPFISPESKFGDLILPKLSNNFFNEMLNTLNLVESAYYLLSSNKFSGYAKLYQFDDAALSQIDKGVSFNIDKITVTKNVKDILKSIVAKIKSGDEEIYEQFKKDSAYNFIQQDIYPTLSLSDKLNFRNYECFHLPLSKKNLISHINTIPLVLFDDPIIAKNIFSEADKNNYFTGVDEFVRKYTPKVFEYIIMNSLDKCLEDKTNLEIPSIFTKSYFMDKVTLSLASSEQATSIFDKLSQIYINNEKNYHLKDMLKSFSKNYIKLENLNMDTEFLMKLYPYFKNNEGAIENAHSFLNKLFDSNKFNEEEHNDFILSIYKSKNDCFDSDSSSKVKKYFTKVSTVKKIIEMHKADLTLSKARGYDISHGFASSHWGCAFTKTSLKNILPLGVDLVYISRHLLNHLPQEVLNDTNTWKTSLRQLIVSNSEDSIKEIRIPKDVASNYEVFQDIFQLSLAMPNKNLAFILKQFPEHFFKKQENLISLLQRVNFEYKNDKYVNIEYLGRYNSDIYELGKKILEKSKKENNNYFEHILTKMLETQMLKETTSNKSSYKPHKF